MGAAIFQQFDCTVANLVSEINTRLAAQGDWTNITGTVMKATTTRGAQMVVNLADTAITATTVNLAMYRTHDGTTGVDKLTRNIYFRANGGTTGDVVHVMLSASKEHFYLYVTGPRVGEPSSETSQQGSAIFLGDLVPYESTDTVPVVVLIATSIGGYSSTANYVNVSRNAADTASWVVGKLASLIYPYYGTSAPTISARTSDNLPLLRPFVVAEDAGGLRGRLAQIFYGGVDTDLSFAAGQEVTYGGITYTLVTWTHYYAGSPFVYVSGGGSKPLLAVPSAGTP